LIWVVLVWFGLVNDGGMVLEEREGLDAIWSVSFWRSQSFIQKTGWTSPVGSGNCFAWFG